MLRQRSRVTTFFVNQTASQVYRIKDERRKESQDGFTEKHPFGSSKKRPGLLCTSSEMVICIDGILEAFRLMVVIVPGQMDRKTIRF